MNLKKLTPGQEINANFAIIKVEEKRANNGKLYKTVELTNLTGIIGGKIWEEAFATAPLESGKVFQISAKVDSYHDILSLNISQAYLIEEEFENYISPRPTLVFDIETAGKNFDELSQWDQDYLLNNLEKQNENKKEAKERTGLYPLYGQIVSIGMFNPESQKGMVYLLGDKKLKPAKDNFIYQTFKTEKELLQAFWDIILKYERYVTYNGSSFDFPFLILRSALHKVKVPIEINNRQDTFVDLMYKIKTGSRGFKLEALCRFFGLENPKEVGISGMYVAKLYQKGKVQEIADYVARDAEATSQLYLLWKKYMAGKIII
ncbi:hypothetical protein GYA19_00475 [Candidatus Beckwithbacteria bacterium]|nr:hypothetical protein [Candidatus Beckwithbacteria bacterium]